MDKSRIPTKEITVGKGDYKTTVKIYEWLTQEEEDQRLNLLMGDREHEFDVNTEDQKGAKKKTESAQEKVKMKVKLSDLSTARKYLVEHMCADITWDDFNTWHPDVRTELYDILEKQVDKKK